MTSSESIWRRSVRGDRQDLSRRAGLFFTVGATCFAVGSVPFFFLNVPGPVVGWTFFIGSIFFTSAGVTQWIQVVRARSGGVPRFVQFDNMTWWAVIVQLVGMVFFNVNTFRAAFEAIPADDVNRLIWAPDVFGSVAFLIASHLAWLVVCGGLWCLNRDRADWWIAALNYLGSVFFMVSAVAAFTLQSTGDVLSIALVNLGTFLGAVCFFVGAYLLLPRQQ